MVIAFAEDDVKEEAIPTRAIRFEDVTLSHLRITRREPKMSPNLLTKSPVRLGDEQ